jgi:hypothetical protein
VLLGELRIRLEAHRQARAALARRPQGRDQIAEAVHSLIRARQNVRYAMEACRSTEDRLTVVIQGLRDTMPEVTPEIWQLVEHLASRPESQAPAAKMAATSPAAAFDAALDTDDQADDAAEPDYTLRRSDGIIEVFSWIPALTAWVNRTLAERPDQLLPGRFRIYQEGEAWGTLTVNPGNPDRTWEITDPEGNRIGPGTEAQAAGLVAGRTVEVQAETREWDAEPDPEKTRYELGREFDLAAQTPTACFEGLTALREGVGNLPHGVYWVRIANGGRWGRATVKPDGTWRLDGPGNFSAGPGFIFV